MKKLLYEEWSTEAGRKLFRRLDADQYEVGIYSCTGAELAELGAAIADALAVRPALQPTTQPQDTVFRCHECGLAKRIEGHTLTPPSGWSRDENDGFVTCPDCRTEDVVE